MKTILIPSKKGLFEGYEVFLKKMGPCKVFVNAETVKSGQEVVIIIGARISGKTCSAKEVAKYLRKKGIKAKVAVDFLEIKAAFKGLKKPGETILK